MTSFAYAMDQKGRPYSIDLASTLSSMSVMLRMNVTSLPARSSQRRNTS
jgi:hypothetical protein